MEMTSDFPEYSHEGKLGLAVLHSYWACAAIYCEDDLHEIFYERLIKKLVPNSNEFIVICLGGKSEVIKAAKNDQRNAPIPEIFILDKDYDDITGEYKKYSNNKNFSSVIYLRQHSIENYLSQFDALLEITLEQKASSGKSKHFFLDKIKDRDAYLNKLLSSLELISRYFSLARKLRIKIKTSKISCNDIYTKTTEDWPLPADEWLEKYKNIFFEKCIQDHEWLINEEALQEQLSTAFDAKDKPWGNLPPAAHIVGKHLLGGLIRYMDSRLESTLSHLKDTELYTRLATHISTEQLNYLGEEIIRLAPSLEKQGNAV